MRKPQERALILGAVIEFIGILGLAIRFGARKGGIVLLVIASIALGVGIILQVRAILQARNQPSDHAT